MYITLTKRHIKTALYLIMTLSLSGCVQDTARTHSTVLENITKDNLHTQFVDGKTTKQDVLIKLGPSDNTPNDISKAEWRYHYRQETRSLLIPRVGPFAGADKMLTLSFDTKGILVKSNLIEKTAH